MVTKIDVDKATERAWDVLRHDLARRMAVCLRDRPHPGILLEIEAPEREQTPCSPYVMAYVEDDVLTVELSSNNVVHPRFRLDKEARRALRRAGWSKPDASNRNHWMSLREGDDLEAAAGLVVAALREAYGVLHPAFLVDSLDLVVDEDPTGLEMEPPVRPLDVRVDETLAEVLGHPPERDADGDIPLRVGDSVLFVRTTADATTIQVFAELVVEVDDLERAAFEVGVLNREVSGCQFVLAGPMIVMRREVMAAPYVGEHLLRAVDEASHAAERWAAVTAVRVGGRCFLDVD